MCFLFVAVGNAFAYSADHLIQLVEANERYSGSELDSDSESSSAVSAAAVSSSHPTGYVNKRSLRYGIGRGGHEIRCDFCHRRAKKEHRRRIPGTKLYIHTNCRLDRLRLQLFNESRSKFDALRKRLELSLQLSAAAPAAASVDDDEKKEAMIIQAANKAEALLMTLPTQLQEKAVQSTLQGDVFHLSAELEPSVNPAAAIGEHFENVIDPLSFDNFMSAGSFTVTLL